MMYGRAKRSADAVSTDNPEEIELDDDDDDDDDQDDINKGQDKGEWPYCN